MRVAPKMLQLEEAGDLDFRNDLVAAAIEIYEARAGGARMSLRELADQRPLGRTPETQAFLDYFAANPTKENEPVRIFNELADWATANHYDPTGMFADESPVATRVDLMAEFADLAGVEVDPTVLAQIGATVSREQTIEKVRTRISEQLAETGMDADQVDAQATLWTGAVMRLAAQNEVEPLDILPKIKLDGVVGQSDSFSQVVKVYHDQNLSVGDQVEFARTLREWTSEETLSRARGRSREQIFEEFDNTLTPIAFIPEDFLPHIFVNKLSDDRVYSSQAYFVDHEVNHHGQDILPSDYFRIQEILSEPDEVILDRRKGEDKAIFTKQYGRNYLVVVKIELGADGHLQMYKTLHKTRKKSPILRWTGLRCLCTPTARKRVSHNSFVSKNLDTRREATTFPVVTAGRTLSPNVWKKSTAENFAVHSLPPKTASLSRRTPTSRPFRTKWATGGLRTPSNSRSART